MRSITTKLGYGIINFPTSPQCDAGALNLSRRICDPTWFSTSFKLVLTRDADDICHALPRRGSNCALCDIVSTNMRLLHFPSFFFVTTEKLQSKDRAVVNTLFEPNKEKARTRRSRLRRCAAYAVVLS